MSGDMTPFDAFAGAVAWPVHTGHRMVEVAWYVARHPGCTQQQAALSLSYHGGTSNRYGSAAVQRALSAGLVVDRGGSRVHALYLGGLPTS